MDDEYERDRRGGRRRSRRRGRRKPDPDSSWVGDLRPNGPPSDESEGREGSPKSRWVYERVEGTPWRFKKPEEFQWPDDVKLTGMETPRDLEVLHWLATQGEIDHVIGRVKFGAAVRASCKYLIRLGHPIAMLPTIRGKRQERWVWLPLRTP